jgi:hypothetical protein
MCKRIHRCLRRIELATGILVILSIHASGLSGNPAAVRPVRSVELQTWPGLQNKTKDIDPNSRAAIAKGYGNLPLSFEANDGQVDSKVKFLSKGNGYTLFLTSTEAVLSVRRGSTKGKDHYNMFALGTIKRRA